MQLANLEEQLYYRILEGIEKLDEEDLAIRTRCEKYQRTWNKTEKE